MSGLHPCFENQLEGASFGLLEVVLPNAQHVVIELSEHAIDRAVSEAVASNLCPPVLAIGGGRDVVRAASVKETAVRENSKVKFGQDCVWPAGKALGMPFLLVAREDAFEKAVKRAFRARVGASDAGHRVASLRSGEIVGH